MRTVFKHCTIVMQHHVGTSGTLEAREPSIACLARGAARAKAPGGAVVLNIVGHR
jgi:hypothetical protein